MPLTLTRIQEAQTRILPYIYQTPVLRLPNLDPYLGCKVYIKAENFQITGAFKLRGAMNKVLSLSKAELARGVVAASSGNHGRALAYAAKMLGAKATIVVPLSTPSIKVEAIRNLGATVEQCETKDRFTVAETICQEQQAVMVPPYNDEDIMAGQGTIGLEIAAQLPTVQKVISPISGGGLLGGTATALKALLPHVSIYGAEPATLPRYSESMAAGHPVTVEQKTTIADALVSQTPGSICYPYVAENVTKVVPVKDEAILEAMKLLLSKGNILAEASSCIGMAAVLQKQIPVASEEKVCFIVSGGNVSLEQVQKL